MTECVFCSIVAGKIPSKRVYEDESTLAFLDINPRNPGHTLVIPKKHYEAVWDMPDSELGKLFQTIKKIAISSKKTTNADGVSIAQSNGRAAGQLVPHVHFHVIPRFSNEGPVGLEGILPAKKFDDGTMDKIAEAIKTEAGKQPVTSPRTAAAKKEDISEEDEDIFNF